MKKARERGAVAKPGRGVTVADFLTDWLERCELSCRPSTVQGYRSKIDQYLIPQLGAKRLDNLAPVDIHRCYRWMIDERKVSASTVAGAHRVLRSALNYAMHTERLIGRNPALRAALPKVTTKEIDPLSIDEVRAVIKVAMESTDRNGARWLVALMLGVRQGEALGLKWSDVDFETDEITVRRALSRGTWQHGCAETCGHKQARMCPQRRGGGLLVGEPKSQAGIRVVAMPSSVVAELKRHKKAQALEQLRVGVRSDDGWLFATETGNPIDPRADWGAWRDILKAGGLSHARLHAARHTTATMLLDEGVLDIVTMTVMGWSQAAMLRRYQHVKAGPRRAAAAELEQAVFGTHETATETSK